MKRLLILTTLLISTACAAPVAAAPTVVPSHTPPPTGTSTATPTATTTPTPTITPSPTITPTATEIQPTPDFLQLPFANNILFAPAADPDCQLPCWQGLRVGESDREDIQRMFDEVYGFNGTIDFFDPPEQLFASVWEIESPGFYTTGYEWPLNSEGTAGTSIQVVVEESTGILQGIQFRNVPGGYYDVHTIHRLIHELGTPDYIYIEVYVNKQRHVTITFQMTYKTGVHFGSSHILFAIPNDTDQFEAWCLDEVSGYETANYNLVAPFDEWGEGAAIHEEWIFNPIFRRPLDQVLDLTIEEFAAIALQDDPCIEINQDLLLDQ